MTAEPLARLLTAAQAADYLGVKPQTLRKWRLHGTGPVYLRIGTGARGRVAYRAPDVQAWLDKHAFASTTLESEARARSSVTRPA